MHRRSVKYHIEKAWAMMHEAKLLMQTMGLQPWVVPNENKLMWMSCGSCIKGALFLLISCLRPVSCTASSGPAMPTTAPFIDLFVHLFILFIIPSYFGFQTSLQKLKTSNIHIHLFNYYASLLSLFHSSPNNSSNFQFLKPKF